MIDREVSVCMHRYKIDPFIARKLTHPHPLHSSASEIWRTRTLEEKECRGWIRFTLSDTRCWLKGFRSGRAVLRKRRLRKTETFVPLVHYPGDGAQVDFFERINGEAVIAFRENRTLGIRKVIVFEPTYPRPTRSRAYASPISLLRPSQGSLPARMGSPLAGRDSHPLDDVRNFMESSQSVQSQSTSRAWSHLFSYPPVAAGYLELLADLMCLGSAHAFADAIRFGVSGIRYVLRPYRWHFVLRFGLMSEFADRVKIGRSERDKEPVWAAASLGRSTVTGILSGSLQRVSLGRILRLVEAAGLEADVRVRRAA